MAQDKKLRILKRFIGFLKKENVLYDYLNRLIDYQGDREYAIRFLINYAPSQYILQAFPWGLQRDKYIDLHVRWRKLCNEKRWLE